VSGFLLDVNVLVALFWPAHEHHEAAQAWFAKKSRTGWATTPMTQAGFVRIVSNPAFSRDAVTPSEAVHYLAANLQHRHHRFWPDNVSVPDAVQPLLPRLFGHRQVTDAYLLGVVAANRGKFATFDAGARELLATQTERDALIELIPRTASS
jgi:hypothetical protein